MQFQIMTMLATIPFNEDAFNEHAFHRRRGRRRMFIQLANTSPALLRWCSSAISGFRSLLRSSEAAQLSVSHRAQPILRSGTLHPAPLSFRELAFVRTTTGACADVVPGT
jgi:hypothetical protein